MKTSFTKSYFALIVIGLFILSSCSESVKPDQKDDTSAKEKTESTTETGNKTEAKQDVSEKAEFRKSNEGIIFSFETVKGKKMVIAIDTESEYLVYRFGSDDQIEFEYPSSTENSWDKFEYSYYMRGGGSQNEGMDINSLIFNSETHKYDVYSDYYAPDDAYTCGIRVTDLSTNKTTEIEGDFSTVKGSLAMFRNIDEVKIGGEITF